MFALVEYNQFYNKNLEKLKQLEFIPVIVYNIEYKNKNQFRENLQKILSIKDKNNQRYSAIIIKLLKIDNATIGCINNLKNKFNINIGVGGMNKINRFFLEQTQIDLLLNPQNSNYYRKHDFVHHFNSGINHVLSNLAKENNIGFFFTLNDLSDKKQFLQEIGRINQSLKFANKYNINSLISFIVQKPQDIKSKQELLSIKSIFDISTKQKIISLKILDDIIKNNDNKKLNKHITDQINFE